MSYWDYHNKYVKLDRDYIAMDESQTIISKKEFLNRIIKNNYLPLRIQTKDINQYKLYKIPESAEPDIKRIVIQEANQNLQNLLQENRQIGKFDFIDIEGKIYNNENTQGKVIVIKCWYIGCVACVAEFPDVNRIVRKYNKTENILFLSLAFDKKEILKKFLIKNPLKYNVISDQKKYLLDDLGVNIFPTHLIIKDGVILKRVNNFEDLEIFLRKLLGGT